MKLDTKAQVIEEKFGQPKSVSRLYSVQALFQMEACNASLERVQIEFEAFRSKENKEIDGYVKPDLDLFRNILRKMIYNQAYIDNSIKKCLKSGWSIDRIDPTLLAILRAASAEILIDTPPKVVINEFVEIAKAFFPKGKEYKLANGILDNLAKDFLRDS